METAQELMEMAVRLLSIVALLCIVALPALSSKSGRTYYTDGKKAIMRANLEKYEWARQQRDAAIAAAEKWAAYSDEKLRTLPVPPEVPRGYQVHNFGCPVHGVEVHKNGLYKWIIDFDSPWKVKCPVGGEEYPSNDFGAFLASDMKDRSLLTGEYADDGWGWNKAGDEANYWFVAYYAHWSMSRFMIPAIEALARATVVAEDENPELARKFAHKCAVILWQLAEYYPDYQYETQSREGKEHNPNYRGKWTNYIWEVATPATCGPAYDAVWPYLRDDAALQEITGKTGEEIDEQIRDDLLLLAARLIPDPSWRIKGNYGMHQDAIIKVAAALDETEKHPTSAEMVQYVLGTPEATSDSDLGLRDALENTVYRDGIPKESLAYNLGWVYKLSDIAQSLLEVGVNVYENPRFQAMLLWPFETVIAGQFTPPTGDTGDMFAPQISLSPQVAAGALAYIKDARLAAIVRENPGGAEDLFRAPVAELLEGYEEPPEQGIESRIFPGYGMAYLQNGSEQNRTASALLYGDYPAHRHADQLNMLLFSQGNALLSDIGYPEQTDRMNHRRYSFFGNTVSHNTVVVNEHMQSIGPGRLWAYQPNGFAQVVDASCEGAYPETEMYRRVNMMVELSDTESYLFDVFYVRGGYQHDYVAFGPPSEVSAEPPLGPAQEKGTLAGEDVPFQYFYDAPELAVKPLGTTSYLGYGGSGFQELFNVRRAHVDDRAVFEWTMKAPDEGAQQYPWKGIGLRAHIVGNDEELIAADAKPQKYERLPDTLQYMLRRRVHPDGKNATDLQSAFVTVYEPYKDGHFVQSVEPVTIEPDDGNAVAARVNLANGETHYVFHSLHPEQSYVLDGKIHVSGQAACIAMDDDETPMRAMLMNGRELCIGDFALHSEGLRKTTITSVDYENGVIELEDPVLNMACVPGISAIVGVGSFHDSATMKAVVDERHFSIGNEDLLVAGGAVKEVVENRILTNVGAPFAQSGMTVLNSAWEPVGKIKAGEKLSIDRGTRGALSIDDFGLEPDGSQRRFKVVVAGPGDAIWIPSYVEFSRR